MSKTWYPVLNYELCSECGTCFNKCTHGVYSKEGNRPVVVSPEGCVQGCHGCGNLCPTGAIEYVGDIQQDCCGSGGCGAGSVCCG